ncbi:hypothetical protein SAMN05216270_10586 [Glycomyces harbinensis]|uniref:Major facilitator superfamily (MFS) profile domain-containing protein n=2 Tax=Glycomyces harbinensis TaxID=58114 RepID=A0A1G6VQW7_9ACTN|nr:hypothetical protein SAMN05216270_10586 [Glycomyces harbinensis]
MDRRRARDTAPPRWAPALWGAYAQAVAFAAAAVTAFLSSDVAAGFDAEAATRWWPLAAFAVGFVAASNAVRHTGGLAGARRNGSIALAVMVFAALALALAPFFAFAVGAAGVLGAAAGLTVMIAGRVVAAAEIGDGSASVTLSAAALLGGIAAGVGALFALPLYGWRGVFGLVVVLAALAAWQFAAYVPSERER